jgi:TonB-dependent receptor
MLRNAFSMLTLMLALMMTPTVFAQTVSGVVTDPEKKVPFQGAAVRIENRQGSAITDARGRFRLNNVAPGNYTLLVMYIGAEDTRVPITVTADGLNMGDVVIGASADSEFTMEEVLIYGQAAAVAGALSQERSAENLVSVLDTDAMGQFPDQNVAESLNRLVGVTVETDQGEGRYVVIRGMDPDLNATSINGVRATSAEPRRALQLDVIASDLLDGLEINKTLTPDMDGDAIGGSINIKTLSAFSRNGTYAKARVEGGYNELREKWSPKLSFAGSKIYELEGEKRLGVAGALSWNDRRLLVNNNEADDWDVADNGNDFMEEFQPRLYTVDRERMGAALNFDFDASEATTLHLYTLYSKFEDTESRYRLTFGLDGVDEDSVTADRASYYEAEVERDTKDRSQTAENSSISFGSATQTENWLIEGNIAYSFAKEETPDQVEGTWVSEFESGDGPITEGSPVLTMNTANKKTPSVESAFWPSFVDTSLFELDEIENTHEKNQDEQTSLRFDAARAMNWGELKFGGKVRLREKKTNEDAEIYSNDDTWFLSDVACLDCASAYGFPTPIDPTADLALTRQILNSGEGIEFEEIDSQIDSNVADFKYKEDIYATYLMGRWESKGITTINGGVRVEWTEIKNSGNAVELFEEGQEMNGVILEDDVVVVTPITRKNSYTDVLPSINLKFDFNENLVGRLSGFKSVVRPRIEETAFRVAIEDDEAEVGNPDLDPFRAINLDASIAWYPTDLAVLSAGVFYKTIEDFIFVQVLEDYEFEGRVFDEIVIAQNGDDADVKGIEVNYQQHFGFLGAPWDAFLVAINYTYVDSEADTGERIIALPKQSADVASFMIGYDKHGLNLRLSMSHRGKYLDELVDEDYDRFVATRTTWDLTARYDINDNWQIYTEIANMGDAPEHYYSGRKSRLLQYDEFGTSAALGVQWVFK